MVAAVVIRAVTVIAARVTAMAMENHRGRASNAVAISVAATNAPPGDTPAAGSATVVVVSVDAVVLLAALARPVHAGQARAAVRRGDPPVAPAAAFRGSTENKTARPWAPRGVRDSRGSYCRGVSVSVGGVVDGFCAGSCGVTGSVG